MMHDSQASFYSAILSDLRPKKVLSASSAFDAWWQANEGLRKDQIFTYKQLLGIGATGTFGEEAEWDLCIFDEMPIHEGQRTQLLGQALKVSRYVLLNTAVLPEHGRNAETGQPGMHLSDLLEMDPVRFDAWGSGSRYGGFLFSHADPAFLKKPRPEQAFIRMIERHAQNGHESVCGLGSSLTLTVEVRRQLPKLIEELSVRSLLDAPCGDFYWMKLISSGIERYIGADVLPGLITQNRLQFSGPSRRFIVLDIQKDSIPQVDLIFCRDCLVHFCHEDALRALHNFKRSGSTYLLTTTFPDRKTNTDIITGDYQNLNLELAPFYLPSPIRIIDECSSEEGDLDKSLGLWKLADIPELQVSTFDN